MTYALPNPFQFHAGALDEGCGTAAGPDTDPPVPAAGGFVRGFDPDAFMDAIEPAPAFLSDPSPEFLSAIELIPMLAVLAGH